MSMVLGKFCSQVEDYVCWRVSFATTSWKIERTRSCCFETYEIRRWFGKGVCFRSKRGGYSWLPGDSKWPFYPLFGGHLAFEKVTYTPGNVTFQERKIRQSSNFFVLGSCLGTFRFWKRLAHYLKLDATEVWFGWWKPCDKEMEWICKFGMFEPPLTKRNKRSPFAVCTPAPYKRVGSLHPRDPITSWEW